MTRTKCILFNIGTSEFATKGFFVSVNFITYIRAEPSPSNYNSLDDIYDTDI